MRILAHAGPPFRAMRATVAVHPGSNSAFQLENPRRTWGFLRSRPACADLNFSNRPVRTRMPGGMGGGRSLGPAPIPILQDICKTFDRPEDRDHRCLPAGVDPLHGFDQLPKLGGRVVRGDVAVPVAQKTPLAFLRARQRPPGAVQTCASSRGSEVAGVFPRRRRVFHSGQQVDRPSFDRIAVTRSTRANRPHARPVPENQRRAPTAPHGR